MDRNSCSFYMRVLRAAYNKGVREGLATQDFPFGGVYTGVARTPKRAVDGGDCPRVATAGPVGLARPRTLKGPVRVRLLRPGNDVRGYGVFAKGERERGRFTYRRHKTGQRPTIRVEPCMEAILKLYTRARPESPLRLPDPYRHGSGTGIPPISDRVELPQPEAETAGRTARHTAPLSSYTPRHSWATAARDRGVPLAVISAGMGHSSEKTTLIYLDSLDNAVIDNANERILRI